MDFHERKNFVFLFDWSSQKFVPNGPIDNESALVWRMAWHWTAITGVNVDTVYWRIYAALGGDELMIIVIVINI